MNALEELELKRENWQKYGEISPDRVVVVDDTQRTRAYYQKQKSLNHVKPIECEIEIVNKTYGWRR